MNELLEEEDEEAPQPVGGQRPPTGGHRFLGARRVLPTLLLTRAGTKPPSMVRHPRVPKEG